MRIDVWSDLVCPWCYIGKRRLERALADFAHRESVIVVHHAYQLHPDMPVGTTVAKDDMLMRKYGMSPDQLHTMHERLERVAAEEGLDYDLTGGVTGNTVDGHRLVHHAATLGKQDAMVERLFRAYFTERRSIFEHESLVELAAEVGLEAAPVRELLAGDAHAETVTAEHHEAVRLGSHGVPFFVIDGRYGISGAQPLDVFASTLNQAWEASQAATVS